MGGGGEGGGFRVPMGLGLRGLGGFLIFLVVSLGNSAGVGLEVLGCLAWGFWVYGVFSLSLSGLSGLGFTGFWAFRFSGLRVLWGFGSLGFRVRGISGLGLHVRVWGAGRRV